MKVLRLTDEDRFELEIEPLEGRELLQLGIQHPDSEEWTCFDLDVEDALEIIGYLREQFGICDCLNG